ncbi:ADP-ribose diphosphatase [Shewanella eurypsychrophilus]|uniref:ADP-ribose pyrophosphatase n=1 Tax=Shewanella eurypsychrophilus TaxID=2593656 RepID=A0ABX6VAE1_9GAMM|nr:MULTISPECIES: ADP-ribose diphosphatase [Shewanella]QFU24447.1 ADP-ribose diphosphatase [Shewanella sp. YLB-09]QPG59647.1 ADP-ribose diphosphatase [Shewanella eurypsychrophilus]
MKQSFGQQDVDLLGKETVFKGFFSIDVYRFKHKLFKGGWSGEVSREVFERGDAVLVLPYDPVTDEVVLIEQIRIPVLGKTNSPWMLELVAGMVEEGETSEGVAERELLEEAGVKARNISSISSFFSSPGGTSEKFDFFWAEVDASEAKGIHGLEYEDEDIKVHVFSREQAYKLVNDGTINNASTVIGLQWLQLNYQTLGPRN